MNINFDLSNSNQSHEFFKNLETHIFEKFLDFSRKHKNKARFIGLPIGICLSLLEIAKTVSIIGERLIKSVANVVGSPFTKKCNLETGMTQLLHVLIIDSILGTMKLAVKTAGNIVAAPCYMFVDPEKTLTICKELTRVSYENSEVED